MVLGVLACGQWTMAECDKDTKHTHRRFARTHATCCLELELKTHKRLTFAFPTHKHTYLALDCFSNWLAIEMEQFPLVKIEMTRRGTVTIQTHKERERR